MKKLLSIITLVAIATLSNAAIIFEEKFDYADGPLVQVSGGKWATHSGTANQVDVSNKVVRLTRNESEDVNALLPGGPYSSGVLYVSFVVNFSELPNSDYFAHLKDNTNGFRGKIFATTNGAASGYFRLGISKAANSPNYTAIPFDLSLNRDYLVVLRYNVNSTDARLWINPVSEETLVNYADATDTTSTLPIYAFALRQSSGIGSLTIDNIKVGTAFSDVVSVGSTTNPPVISGIGNQYIAPNTSTAPLPFTVLDAETPAESLIVTAVSDNQLLVPDSNITISGTSTNRTITVTPAPNQQGTAQITVTVRDTDNNIASVSFYVIVGAPSISSIPNQIVQKNTTSFPIPFTVYDAETPPGSLTLSAQSSNPSIISVSGIVFGGSGSNRTVQITPAQDAVGVVTLSVIVSDGSNNATNKFVVTVTHSLGLEMYEPFDYPDGALRIVSGYRWDRHSGGTNEMMVINGKLFLTQTNTEDTSALLYYLPMDGYYSINGGYILYSSFELKYVDLPTASGGDYFAHYRDTGTLNYRARVFATTNGAAPGHYRVGIANGGIAPAVVPVDLKPNIIYTIMTRYNVGTGESKIWVNPSSESDPGAEATDPTTPVDIWSFSFRQNSGIGSLFVDNLRIAGSFAEAYVAPNLPPTISSIADQITQMNTATAPIQFTVYDNETPANELILQGSSSNPNLVPNQNFVFGESGTNRTVTVTPAANQTGEAVITISVTDGGGQVVQTSFKLTVLAPNNPPVISAIPDQRYFTISVPEPIPFTVYDYESPADSLQISGETTNPLLVNAIVFGGSGSNRTVLLILAPNQLGSATVTIYVSDGVNVTSRSFNVIVSPAVLLEEHFNYTDGSVITNSGFLWNAHSGATGQTMVVSGKLVISGAQSEDINAVLTNAPYAPDTNVVLYAGMTVIFTNLPGSAYFAHFKDAATGFRCRLFATSSGAPANKFRLGIANNASAANVVFPADLSLFVPHRVVLRYNTGAGISTLWVNEGIESGQSVTATDTPSPITVTSFALRQATGIGTILVDDIIVAIAFNPAAGAVSTEPPLLKIFKGNNTISLNWTAQAYGFALENINKIGAGSWQQLLIIPDVIENNFNITLPLTETNTFFRLKK